MSEILTTQGYRLYWYDADKTIIVLEVRARWTWEDAKESLDALNSALVEIPPQVATFSVIHFLQGVATLPDGINITTIRDLVLDDTEYEKLVIFVGSQGLLVNILKMAVRVYNLPRDFARYRFVNKFTDALVVIEDYHHAQAPLKKDA